MTPQQVDEARRLAEDVANTRDEIGDLLALAGPDAILLSRALLSVLKEREEMAADARRLAEFVDVYAFDPDSLPALPPKEAAKLDPGAIEGARELRAVVRRALIPAKEPR